MSLSFKAPRINVPKELLPGGEDGADGRHKVTAEYPGNLNEGVSAEEANGAPRSAMSEGPKRLENGAYSPARYELRPGVVCEDR